MQQGGFSSHPDENEDKDEEVEMGVEVVVVGIGCIGCIDSRLGDPLVGGRREGRVDDRPVGRVGASS